MYTVLNKRTGLTFGLFNKRSDAQKEADFRNKLFGRKPTKYQGFSVSKIIFDSPHTEDDPTRESAR